jgi:hypothetical protein
MAVSDGGNLCCSKDASPRYQVGVCVNQIWCGSEEDARSKAEEEDGSESEVVDNADE